MPIINCKDRLPEGNKDVICRLKDGQWVIGMCPDVPDYSRSVWLIYGMKPKTVEYEEVLEWVEVD